MAGSSEMTQEDISWHKPDCPHRRFMEENRERNLKTEASVRNNLQLKYLNAVIAKRAGRRRRRKTRRSVAPKPLKPEEWTEVNKMVNEALDPNGAIKWYLDSQRKEFDEAKLRFLQQCDCVNVTRSIVDETLAKTTGAVAESGVPIAKEEAVSDDDDNPFMRF
ncbi:unnamed protein product [Orchesella dallaii]|uniref:Uncharacterized protein n=1 Tax=Orchesella dallaii TaxID=48710 RepID=A0ABP1QJI5_9HEXA